MNFLLSYFVRYRRPSLCTLHYVTLQGAANSRFHLLLMRSNPLPRMAPSEAKRVGGATIGCSVQTCGCAKQPEGFHFLSAPTTKEPLNAQCEASGALGIGKRSVGCARQVKRTARACKTNTQCSTSFVLCIQTVESKWSCFCLIDVSMDPEGLNGVQGTTGGCSGKERWEYPRLCQADETYRKA